MSIPVSALQWRIFIPSRIKSYDFKNKIIKKSKNTLVTYGKWDFIISSSSEFNLHDKRYKTSFASLSHLRWGYLVTFKEYARYWNE